MKRLIVFALILVASTAYAGGKKKMKTTPKAHPMEKKWDADPSLFPFGGNSNFTVYGVKGTAKTLEGNGDTRTAWVALLYTPSGRRGLKGAVKGSYYTREKWNVSCKLKRFNASYVVYYDYHGSVVKSYEESEQWDEIVPGSVAQAFYDIICSGPPGADAEGAAEETPQTRLYQ